MTSQHKTVPDLWALLIGIDCYMPNLLRDGTYYRSLAGCVRDILRIEQFLRGELGLTDKRLIRLTASRGGRDNPSSRGAGEKPSLMDDEKPSEPPEQWPTYANILQAFHNLKESAQPGELIYIHYSGHGGRVKTLPKHRALIPYKHIDEALVPTDLGDDEGRYLRDIELAFLLQKLVDKGLFVTLVLDSCHSGSATRAGAASSEAVVAGATVRGSGSIDTRSKPSLVASDEELVSNWLRLSPPVKRDFYVGSGWLPDPQGYVLLAACRAHEGAHEYPFDGVNKQGALTYWLLDSFGKFGDGATYRRLHQYIQAKISEQFEQQNPQVEGEGDRVVFGRESIEVAYAFVVRNVDEATGQVTLNAGRVHGLDAGTRFALYSAEQLDIKRSDTPLAIAEIVETGITSSRARLVSGDSRGHVEQGDRAVLLEPPTDTPRDTLHLAKYRRVRDLENLDPLSPLLRKFSVELLGVQADYKRGEPVCPRPFAEDESTPAIRVGEWIFLRARNHYSPKGGMTLNVTVLNLRPDSSIRQIFPSRAGLFETLEPGQELLLPLCAELPPDYEEGIDVIKFFVTIEPADFHFLELPPLDKPFDKPNPLNSGQHASRGSTRASSNESQTRDTVVPISEGEDWTTRQFEIRIMRPSAQPQPSYKLGQQHS